MQITTIGLDDASNKVLEEMMSKPEFCFMSKSHIIRTCIKFTNEYLHGKAGEGAIVINQIKESAYDKTNRADQ